MRISSRQVEFSQPAVMGIVNVTPDSFYVGSRTMEAEMVRERTRRLVGEGADMIDVGAYSSRPGADDVSETDEIERLARGLEAIRSVAPDIPVSVDTFRSRVARYAAEQCGADIINDISGGSLDHEMFDTMARLRVPYILMHMRGTPTTMQSMTAYDHLVPEVINDLAEKLNRLHQLGVADVIVDPGFGFSKTLLQNYELLNAVGYIGEMLNAPVLVGVSRKSMITRALSIDSSEALNGTTCLNTIALLQGSSILRVHDVKAAREAVELTQIYLTGKQSDHTLNHGDNYS